jgi:hypothetical protein
VRSHLCDLLNGVFDGELATESWVLSQAYYFGNIGGAHFRCEVVQGQPIDTCAFDGIAPRPTGSRPATGSRPPKLNIGSINGGADRAGGWIAAIKDGGGWHNAVRDLVARMVAKGLSDEEILLIAPGVQWDGYTLEQTEAEIRVFIDSAWRKGFAPSSIDEILAVSLTATVTVTVVMSSSPTVSPWIPDAFWEARKWHRELHDWALNERISPDAALGIKFARIAAAVPKGVRFDTGDDPLSLNVYTALFGASGDGKSKANRKLGRADATDLREFRGLPSGEGLLDASMGEATIGQDKSGKDIVEKLQTEWSALFFIDDADGLMKAGRRPNSTLFSFLEIGFFGDDLRTVNAERSRKRHIKDYSLGLIVGVQPIVSADLAREHTTGLPQRFGWYGTRHPEIGKGRRIVHAPPIAGLTPFQICAFEQEVMDEVDKVLCGRAGDEWWYNHYPALRCKWSIMLALTSGRRGKPMVTMDDWLLAALLWDASLATLQGALADAEAAVELEHEKRVARTVQTAVAVGEARADKPSAAVMRVAENIVRHVASGKTKWRDVVSSIKHSDRPYLHAAATLAVGQGWIVREGSNVRSGATKG